MEKIIILIILFFTGINYSFAGYKLENGSLNLVEKYNISTKNLDKQITRKEFVEILYKWYIDYKKDRGVIVNYDNYKVLNNSIFFNDIDLNSDFGKKLSYFVSLGAFSKREYFDPNGVVTQRDFFTIMRQLRIMSSLQNCKYHRICEKESDEKTFFLKGTYLKYVSKILDKSLRKYYSKPSDYIDAGYKSYLSPSYLFPIITQTINGCYAFSVRNILKYKDGIGIYIPKAEKLISKSPEQLWTYPLMNKFDKLAHIEFRKYYHLDTLINSLQAGEPVSVSYMLEYYSRKDKKYKKVPHIVAAYSFDNDGVWVAETVTARRMLVPWDKLFNSYGGVALNRIFKYYYIPKEKWSKEELEFEKKNNILVGEY